MDRRKCSALCCSVVALTLTLVQAARAALPLPWTVADIGEPGRHGSTDVDASGVWTIKGSGIIYNGADSFQFASQPVSGDATITARFLAMQGNSLSRVGLMVRQDETSGSPHLNYSVAQQLGAGLGVLLRLEPDGLTRSLGEVGPSRRQEPNLSLRLQRVGNEIAGFYSRDGNFWVQADFGPVTLPTLQQRALFGLSATSFDDSSLSTGRFDQVSLQAGAHSVYGIRGCGGDKAVTLQWRLLPNAMAYNIYRGPMGATPDQMVRLTATPVTGSLYTDSSAGLVNGTPQAYAVAAMFPGTDGQPLEGPLVAIQAIPVAVLPGFLGCSIDEGPHSGSASYDPATQEITLRGSGFEYDQDFNIWSGNNQGYFLSQPVNGDVQITVKSLSKPPGGFGWSSARLLISESLDGGARSMFIGPTSGAGLVARWRLNPNDFSDGAIPIGNAALKLPVTLRLSRRGSTIFAEYSTDDGKTFQSVDQYVFEPPLAKTVYVGLAMTANNRTTVSETRFSVPEIQKLSP